MEAFVNYMSPTPVEDEVRALTVQLVSNAIVKSYRDAQVLPFGSYETKLYLPTGYATKTCSTVHLHFAHTRMQRHRSRHLFPVYDAYGQGVRAAFPRQYCQTG